MFIADTTVSAVAERLAEYARAKSLESVSVILHGGEPLLVGPARLRDICEELTRTISPVTTLDLRMHTNGLQLNQRVLDVCLEFNVKIGISLDGDKAANDRHRLDRRGRSSYDRVVRAVDLLRTPRYRPLYLGLLCTIDVANDPVDVHEALTRLDPPRIDYLLPHSTWDNPPPSGPSESQTPYADWLLKIFDKWTDQGRTVPVRTFDSVLSTLRGGPSLTEAMGLAPSDLAVVETDGSYEQADSLKTAYDGAPATGYEVFRHGFEEFSHHPGVRARQAGISGVSEQCRRCPVVESCGGGLYAHRFSTQRGFDNPSVFCADLKAFVEGVAARSTEHELSPAVHDSEELRFAQAELDRTLLAKVQGSVAAEPDWDEAWKLLLALDAEPGAARPLETVLTHPYLRPALHRAWHGPADLPRFMAVVAATAIRAGHSTTLSWEQPGEELYLPTLGTLTLGRPGRVAVQVTGAGWLVRDATDRDFVAAAESGRWRPLHEVDTGRGGRLLIDDADPCRDCYRVPATPPLDPSEQIRFGQLLDSGGELARKLHPDHAAGRNALALTTVTPLAAGSGLQLGTHSLGALGVGTDCTPEEFARSLPGTARRARLTALRETTDLHLLGTGAGRLFDEVCAGLGEASYHHDDTHRRRSALERARLALESLAERPEGELTRSGSALADEWRAELDGLLEREVREGSDADDGDVASGWRRLVRGQQLTELLRDLELPPGGVLMVHASLAGTGLRDTDVRDALRTALGPDGTLIVPAFTPENSDTSRAHLAEIADLTEQETAAYRESMLPFNPETTPCPSMGLLADCVRSTRGAVRSAHPQTSLAGLGPRAAELLDGHDPHCHLGENSPLAKLYAREDAHILLFRVGFEVCSAFHLAEYLMDEPPPLRTYRCVTGEKGHWISYEDRALNDSDFGAVGALLPERDYRKMVFADKAVILIPFRKAVDFARGQLTKSRQGMT